jgi:hypothetical protein
MEHKALAVAVVVPLLMMQVKMVLVVPVSFSSHILHKYSKNRKWA